MSPRQGGQQVLLRIALLIKKYHGRDRKWSIKGNFTQMYTKEKHFCIEMKDGDKQDSFSAGKTAYQMNHLGTTDISTISPNLSREFTFQGNYLVKVLSFSRKMLDTTSGTKGRPVKNAVIGHLTQAGQHPFYSGYSDKDCELWVWNRSLLLLVTVMRMLWKVTKENKKWKTHKQRQLYELALISKSGANVDWSAIGRLMQWGVIS